MTRPITDAEVEAVARAYCLRMAQDPDGKTNLMTTKGVIYWTGPKWEAHKEDARRAIAWRLAVNEVIG
jgi:hypothetical protein